MRKILRSVILFVLSLAAVAYAQSYPTRPLRVIVAYPPGGSTDIIARMIAQKLTERLGQTVLVDNRGGAAGMIGAEIVARATPDGHTIMLADSPFVVNPSIFAKVPYDPIRDFTPITLVGASPMMLVVTASLPARNLAELLKLGRAHPGKLTIGSAGIGATSHVVAELFKLRAGVNLTHVPYKGVAPALADVVAGQIDSVFSTLPTAAQLVRSGKLQALGIATKKRVSAFPEVPTLEESGIANFEAFVWYGYQGPAQLPRPVVERLNGEIVRAAELPDVRERMLGLGLETMILTPKPFAQFIVRDLKKWAEVVRLANIKAQ
ncbi:MAG: tripartite tricarboxylate transporter substrate binding protein [Burkholderiales bacterium]|nr:tripartite tricarboxylate transporter substrate binding protein [Burkholderiales bacterium]